MKTKRLIPMIAVAATCLAGGLPVASASAATEVAQATSQNWSGYVVGASSSSGSADASGSSDSSASGEEYKSVSGSWVVPTAKCTDGETYSAFWVGLGGSGQSDALEQDGTESNCSANGTASYYAWYELVPSAPVKVSMAVKPGDHISSKVTVNGSNVTVSVSNATTGGSFSKTLQMSNPDISSAEWIAEAPSACDSTATNCTPLPLTDFGSVKFTNATATTTGGHTGTISDGDWSAAAVSLSPGASGMGFADYTDGGGSAASSAGAIPSSLSSDGASFSVSYSADTSSSGAGTGAGAGDSGAGSGDSGVGSVSGGGGYGYSDGGGGYAYGGGGYAYGGGGYGYGGGGWSDGSGTGWSSDSSDGAWVPALVS